MTATASAGFGFTGWTGSSTTNGATLKFIMASNLTFTANFVDVAKPVLTITAPTANQRLTNAVNIATGGAHDNVGVADVLYQLDGAGWTEASTANGWTNWSTPYLALGQGSNTIQAYAVDAAGNRSPTNTVNFTFAQKFDVLETTSQFLSASEGGTITLPSGSFVQLDPASLSQDSVVLVELLSESPIQPTNENVRTVGRGLCVTIQQGTLIGGISFGISVDSTTNYTGAIGTMVSNSEFLPTELVKDETKRIVMMHFNGPSATSGSAALNARLLQENKAADSVGINNQLLAFASSGEFVVNPQAVYQFNGNDWGDPIDPVSLSGLAGKTVVIGVHGILSDIPNAFPCAQTLANVDPSNTVLLGFQYDFNQDIAFNADAFKAFLQTLVQNNPGLKVNIVAHSMGTLVVAGALRDGTLDPSVISGFYPVAGMAVGTPSACTTKDFVNGIVNTPWKRFVGRLLVNSITTADLINALPTGLSQLCNNGDGYAAQILTGMHISGIGQVRAYGSTGDIVVPIDSVQHWTDYFPNASIKDDLTTGHSGLQCTQPVLDDLIQQIRGGTCTYTYTAWSACQPDNTQTRTVISSSPAGCTGTPTLSRPCTYVPPTCTYTYSAWSACQPNNTQTRTVISSSPAGCAGTPILSQSCTYVPPPSGFTYCINEWRWISGDWDTSLWYGSNTPGQYPFPGSPDGNTITYTYNCGSSILPNPCGAICGQ
jgi:uncharacterized repeat protein (TIGR02543 family)